MIPSNLKKTAALKAREATAFTLVELLVAITILGVMMLALLSITSTVNTTWLSNSKRAEVMQTGRAVMNQIARDLSAALLRPDFKTQYLQFVENPDLSATFTNPVIVAGSDSLFWQSALAKFLSATPPTDDHLTVVGYYLADDATSGKRALYRFYAERPTGATTGVGYNLYQNNPDYNVYWLTKLASATSSPWDGVSTPSNQGASILSSNVVGLWMRCRDVNGNPIPYDQVRGSTYAGTTKLKYDSSWIGTNSRLPASVEITIVCVDSQSLNRLQTQGIPLPTITAVTDPSDTITDSSQAVSGTYLYSINQFVSQLTTQKGIEIQTFTTIVPLLNGSYVNR